MKLMVKHGRKSLKTWEYRGNIMKTYENMGIDTPCKRR
jgi:hypothetical protein